ncbi:MAG: tRNA lysidine(34) synthetase TilS [Gammaproteobacteria bacterium]|nr:tRNA lysidine(34) synthetase TilS [Gammaproteobacteria bacterium]
MNANIEINKFKNKFLHLLSSVKNEETSQIFLGLSGGLDSIVLLDLLYKIDQKITAVYIDHQLQADSDYWAEFNAQICSKYKINFQSIKVDIKKFKNSKNQSLEAAARDARYQAFSELMNNPKDILVTAHHLNDQAETVLLQLMRAAGPKGLSAMPEIKQNKFTGKTNGWHVRPLLNYSREQLLNYAKVNDLTWVDDKTNLDLNFDRNYIRHQIIPALTDRWPEAVNSLARSAQYCAEQEILLYNYIKKDYEQCVLENNILDINELKLFNKLQLKAILRYWFSELELLAPGEKKLSEIIKTCIYAAYQAHSRISIDLKTSLKTLVKDKNKLIILDIINLNNNIINISIKLGDQVDLKDYKSNLKYKINLIKTDLAQNNRAGFIVYVSKEKRDLPIVIKNRNGGERCRPSGRGGSVPVKKLLQEMNIPSWERSQVLLLYIGEEIAGVLTSVGVKICENYTNLVCNSWAISCEQY